MLIPRRTFLGLLSGASLGAGMALSPRLAAAVRAAEEGPDGVRILPSSCDHDCGGRCLMHVHVKDGKVIHITTDDGTLTGAGYGYNQPDQYQLRTCTRGRAYRAQMYSDLRLLHPMKRSGTRGSGKFVPISWDEALGTVAQKIRSLSKQHGPASIFSGVGTGTASVLNASFDLQMLLARLGGFTTGWTSASWEGAHFAMEYTTGYNERFGPSDYADGADAADFLDSKLIILWGWNPSHTHFGTPTRYYLQRAREAGTPMICVDPVYTDTAAAWGTEWIPIRPGSDAAVLMAMAYVILEEKLSDAAYVKRFTEGMPEYHAHLKGRDDGTPKDPRWASALSDVPAESIITLARRYAQTRPAKLMAGWAPGRSTYGEQYHRAALALQAMTGNIGRPGGGGSGHMVGKTLPATTIIQSWWAQFLQDVEVHETDIVTIKTTRMADAILQGKGVDPALVGAHKPLPSPIRMLYAVAWNTVNQQPNVNKTVRALKSLDFIVVQDQRMTPTARFADILLPACTMLERDDFTWPWSDRDPYLIPQPRAVEPLGESRPDHWIFDELAKHLGLKPMRLEYTPKVWLDYLLQLDGYAPFADMVKQGVVRKPRKKLWVAFQQNIENPENFPFDTPSGRIEIKSSLLDGMDFMDTNYQADIPSLPTYLEGGEGPNVKNPEHPLQLLTTKVQYRCHSTFTGNPNLEELFEQDVWIHPRDAQQAKLSDGNMVEVYNGRGRVRVRARVTERIRPGVVMIHEGAWYAPDKNGTDLGGCPNVLTTDEPSPGGAHALNSARVSVRPI